MISMETMSGRAKALLAPLNLHRLLRAVENYLPPEILPVDKLQVRPTRLHPRVVSTKFECVRQLSPYVS